MSEAHIEQRATSIHMPSGEGGSGGRLRFTSRCALLMIVDGKNVSPSSVVCVFMFLLVRAFEFSVSDTSSAC